MTRQTQVARLAQRTIKAEIGNRKRGFVDKGFRGRDVHFVGTGVLRFECEFRLTSIRNDRFSGSALFVVPSVAELFSPSHGRIRRFPIVDLCACAGE
jgi:hypothetical protein